MLCHITMLCYVICSHVITLCHITLYYIALSYLYTMSHYILLYQGLKFDRHVMSYHYVISHIILLFHVLHIMLSCRISLSSFHEQHNVWLHRHVISQLVIPLAYYTTYVLPLHHIVTIISYYFLS